MNNALEGTCGSVREYLYETGSPEEVGRCLDTGDAVVLGVSESGPAIPAGYFAWILRAPSNGLPHVSDVFNIPRYSSGTKRIHKGVDFAESLGQPIYCAYGGTVSAEYVNATDPNLAYTHIQVSHTGGLYSVYDHWDTALAAKGDSVLKGQKIATVGTGLGHYGAHLHFATQDSSGNYVSPAPYYDPAACPISPSSMEFIVHKPLTIYYTGLGAKITASSGRPDQVAKAEVYYRTNSSSPWTMQPMVRNGNQWEYIIPPTVIDGVSSFQYIVKFTRVKNDESNPIDGNYATRPVAEASTLPSAPYTVYKYGAGAATNK